MSGSIAGFGSVPTDGMVVESSYGHTLENFLFKISDFVRPSLTILPSPLNSDMPESTFFNCLIYDQKPFGFSLIASSRKSEMYASLADFNFFCKRFLIGQAASAVQRYKLKRPRTDLDPVRSRASLAEVNCLYTTETTRKAFKSDLSGSFGTVPSPVPPWPAM